MKKLIDSSIVELRTKLFLWSKKFYSTVDNRDDLVNDTILRIYENTDKFDGENLHSWAYRIMSNIFYNDLRLRRECFEIIDDIVTDFVDSSKTLDCKLTLDKYVRDSEKDLGKRILLDYAKGFKYDELATIYCLPLGTVKSKIFSTRVELNSEVELNTYFK